MIRIRCGRGIGDSLYLRPIVDHLVSTGERVTALSDYPDIFIGSGATVEPFSRKPYAANRVANYTHRMHDQTTTQWQDILRSAQIPDIPLRFSWSIKNVALIAGLKAKAAGRPIIVVHGGREPMARNDKYGRDLMPTRESFEAAIAALDDCFTVRIGNAPHLYDLLVSLDLQGSTTVSDLLDIAWACDGVIAQCSFAIPLAECFAKPLLAIWAARGLRSATAYIRTVSPAKVLTVPKSLFVIDDYVGQRIAGVARSIFCSTNGEAERRVNAARPLITTLTLSESRP